MISYIVNFKSFGDFVIANNILNIVNNYNENPKIKILAGMHVLKLAESLNCENNNVFLELDNLHDTPSIYDIKKSGLVKSIPSLFKLRSILKNIKGPQELLFDNLGWREKIIGSSHNIHEISKINGNIYLDYLEYFSSVGFLINTNENFERVILKNALIIPSARSIHRFIPARDIVMIEDCLSKIGISLTVILLEGETCELPKFINVKIIPKNFKNLIDNIKLFDLVITADSLSAHLCGYFKINNFVYTPIPNWTKYWLPINTFKTNGMGIFGEINNLNVWLSKYYNL